MRKITSSTDLQPGDRFSVDRNQFPGGTIYTVDRRKEEPKSGSQYLDYHPGWWIVGGGGFADFVLDAYIKEGNLVLIRDDAGYEQLEGWKREAMEVMAHWDEIAAMVPTSLGAYQWDDVRKELCRLRGEIDFIASEALMWAQRAVGARAR